MVHSLFVFLRFRAIQPRLAGLAFSGLFFVGALDAARLPAQGTDQPKREADVMNVGLLARQLHVLAADSFQGRRTPSAALERAARYVAAQFGAIGLQAGIIPKSSREPVQFGAKDAVRSAAEGGIWIQRYPLPHSDVRLNREQSKVVLLYTPEAGGRSAITEKSDSVERRVVLSFTTEVHFVVPRVPESKTWLEVAPPAVLLTGRLTPTFLRQADLSTKAVLYLVPPGLDSAARRQIARELYHVAQGALMLSSDGPSDFAAHQAAAQRQPLALANRYLQGSADDADPHPWVTEGRAASVAGLLGALGIDLKQAAAASAPTVRELPGLRVWLDQAIDSAARDTVPTAPNVIGMVAGGREPKRRRECLVITAPLDQRDSVTGRTVDGSTMALAGLLELAHALRQTADTLTSSIAFIATSGGDGKGEDQEFWGASYFATQLYFEEACTYALLTFTLEPSGNRATGDTVTFAGLNDVDLALSPALIADAHPELRLAVRDGGTMTESRSDARAFTRMALPSLVLQGAAGLDLERVLQRLQLLFYVVKASATASKRPQWSTTGRQRLLQQP